MVSEPLGSSVSKFVFETCLMKMGDQSESGGVHPLPESHASSLAKMTVQNAKFEVGKFDGTNNFGMWQCEVKDVLAQQDLDLTLEDKLEDMEEVEWNKFEMKDLGEARKVLSMEITRNREKGLVYLTQKQYLCKIASMFWY